MQLLKTKPILIALFTAAFGLSAQAAAIYNEVGGIVVVEAEHFDSRTKAEDNDHEFKIAPDELSADEAAAAAGQYLNARGGKYMVVMPTPAKTETIRTSKRSVPTWTSRSKLRRPANINFISGTLATTAAAIPFMLASLNCKKTRAVRGRIGIASPLTQRLRLLTLMQPSTMMTTPTASPAG